MMKGWNAKGRLSAHWQKVGGRDALADLTGIAPTTLSAYNSGQRPLGMGNAQRIAGVKKLGINIFDLGAPVAEATTEQEKTLVDRVAELEQARASDAKQTADLRAALKDLQGAVAILWEAARQARLVTEPMPEPARKAAGIRRGAQKQ